MGNGVDGKRGDGAGVLLADSVRILSGLRESERGFLDVGASLTALESTKMVKSRLREGLLVEVVEDGKLLLSRD